MKRPPLSVDDYAGETNAHPALSAGSSRTFAGGLHLMHVPFLGQGLSTGKRLDAVHEHFSTRSTDDSFHVILAALLLAIVLCGVLVIIYRAQERRRRRLEQDGSRRRSQLKSHRQPLSARRHSRSGSRRV